jgi:uncharacterized glyoxalase superfamily protein PhnB
MSELARRHQLHGLQPVLPVADVPAAAAWLCDVLGFEIDFLHGDPVVHGRVCIVGDWGAPVYIHLAHAGALPVRPCGELRIHVGAALDDLCGHVRASGAEIVLAPTDQPWGLREFVLRTPDGHRLRLCAEAA